MEETRTATEVTKDVVALLREGDLVDSVADEAGFQQVAGILAGLPPVGEAFYVVVEPVHHVRAWGEGCQVTGRPTCSGFFTEAHKTGPREFLGPPGQQAVPSLPTPSFLPPWGCLTDESVGNGNLEPHAVSDLQPRFRGGHGFHNGGHVTVDG